METFSKEQIEYLNGIFVRKDDCNDRHEKEEKELTEIRITLTKISTKQSLIMGVLAFVAGGIGTLLIGAVGSLIFK